MGPGRGSAPFGRVPRPEVGRRAEALAAACLEAKGFRVVERNWRRPEGEIDIVADHEGVRVFVEVRSRTGADTGHPLETINLRKRARVVRAARLYLDEARPDDVTGYRFDVVGVVFTPAGDVVECVHIENAFDVTG